MPPMRLCSITCSSARNVSVNIARRWLECRPSPNEVAGRCDYFHY